MHELGYDACRNDEEGLCVEDAPMAAARAAARKKQIWEKARETQIFHTQD